MREPYTQLYVHLVWSTWDRLPVLTDEMRDTIYRCIQAGCTALNCELIAIGGTDDHIHALVRLPAVLAIAELVKKIKGSSSHLVNHSACGIKDFRWQGAYAAFTLSKDGIPSVSSYIARQEEHHRLKTTDKDMEVGWAEPEIHPAG